jgi:NAD(P)-dependent dehydrogenase (short-subunit alcohol dehydrogenase family)
MLADCMQLEFGKDGISIGYMEPGYTDTPMIDRLLAQVSEDPEVSALMWFRIKIGSSVFEKIHFKLSFTSLVKPPTHPPTPSW